MTTTHAVLTGTSGFVGSHVLRHLLAATDWTIACPVTFRHKGLPRRIVSALEDRPDWWKRVDVVTCDLTAPIDRITLDQLGADRCTALLNVASESHVDRSISDPMPFVANNINLVLNVLEAARKMPQLEKLIQVSTDEVYGPVPPRYNSVEWDPIIPSNPYAASKAAQEAIAISYWRTFGVPVIITNTMNIIGEMQDSEKFIPMTIKRALSGQTMQIHGSADGVPGSRHYLHARNQADALLHLLRTPLTDLHYGPGATRPHRFNIVGEREVDNLDMARMVAEFAGCELKFEMVDFHSSRPGHDLRYAMDGSKMESIGWKAPIPLEDSLRQTVRWTLAHREWL